jgi:hypothetical protein
MEKEDDHHAGTRAERDQPLSSAESEGNNHNPFHLRCNIVRHYTPISFILSNDISPHADMRQVETEMYASSTTRTIWILATSVMCAQSPRQKASRGVARRGEGNPSVHNEVYSRGMMVSGSKICF